MCSYILRLFIILRFLIFPRYPDHPAMSLHILLYPRKSCDTLIHHAISSHTLRYPHISCDFLIEPAISSHILRYYRTPCDILTYPAIFSYSLRYPHISCDIIVHGNVLCRNRKIIIILISHVIAICCKWEFTSKLDEHKA